MTEVQEKIKVFAVCGPTASGKTSLSVTLAKKLHAEVVSCDSMQIYRGMEIGTAKPTADEMQGVPHHLMGFQDPAEPFSVSDYVALAGKVIEDIHARGKNVLLVGGTGLYARSLLKAVRLRKTAATMKSAVIWKRNLRQTALNLFMRG